MLGTDPVIGVWATVSVRRDGVLVQVDRGGHPTINPFINPNDVKDQFNARQPADDVANYLRALVQAPASQRPYARGAAAAARIVLPDILALRPRPAGRLPQRPCPYRRRFSARFAWLTNGKVSSDGLKPHDDLLAEFPYLGLPNLYPAG